MRVQFDILQEVASGRMHNMHSATNDDAAIFDYGGEVIIDDYAVGEEIHVSNFDDVLAMLVVNTGENTIKVTFPADSTHPIFFNAVSVDPGGFMFIPKPENTSSKEIKISTAVDGENSTAVYYVSGD